MGTVLGTVTQKGTVGRLLGDYLVTQLINNSSLIEMLRVNKVQLSPLSPYCPRPKGRLEAR